MIAAAIGGLIALFFLFVIIGPVFTIWALQTLNVPIELTFWTWLSVAWLHGVLAASQGSSGSKKDA